MRITGYHTDSSDDGLILLRELDERLGFCGSHGKSSPCRGFFDGQTIITHGTKAVPWLPTRRGGTDSRGKNTQLPLADLLRQSVSEE